MMPEYLGMLILTLRHKDSGFYLIEAPDNPTMDDLALKITAAAGREQKRTAVINFAEMKMQPGKSITRFVRDAVNEKPDVQIFFLRNMESSSENAQRFLSNLNHAREGIYYLGRNFIFMVYPDFSDLLKKYAPDLLSWIPHKYQFESVYITPGEFAASVQLVENVRFVGDKDRKHIRELIEIYEMQLDESADDDVTYRTENILRPLADLYGLHGDYSREIPVRKQIAQFCKVTDSDKYSGDLASLGMAYLNTRSGCHADNMEKAIGCLQEALELNTRENMPHEWANTVTQFANAYRRRIQGDRAENIEEAIRCCQQALEVRTRDVMPAEWAETTMSLANAYSVRIRGDRAENIEKAIRCYEQVLEVRTRDTMPVDWAIAMTNLASAYAIRIRGDRAENIEKAIRYYRQALEVITRETLPAEWATTRMNLANAYKNRLRGDPAENIGKAMRYEQF